ncbi:MAG: beta-lactamase family protein [Micrococcales bacterium]|nr:beta-lactamase family protein [Micrococcales bacterium]
MSSETDLVAVEDDLDATFAAYVGAGHAPGLVYGLVGPEGLTHSLGVGCADDSGRLLDERTRFPVASISKGMTGAMLLICRERGLLGLDDPITAWVPELRLTGPGAGGLGADGLDTVDPPTLRQLASMSGGLTEDNSWTDVQIDMAPETLAARLAAGVRLTGAPGVAFDYANLGYALLQLAVERAAGEPFGPLVTAELFEPLGLADTSFSPTSHGVERLAVGHVRDEGRWVGLPPLEARAFAGAAGAVSSVADLARWVAWLADGFATDGPDRGPLRRAARRELQRVETVIPPQVSAQPEGTWAFQVAGYGLGLVVEHDLRHGVVVSHTGGLPGYRLHVRWHASGLGLVVATTSHRGDPITLAVRALSRLLVARDVPARTVRLWPETVAARRDVELLVRGWDDAVASRLFAENVEVDRPLLERRAQIERLVAEVGPLRDPLPAADVIGAASPAEVTWSIPGERGELVCMVHLTGTEPPAVQEMVVRARVGGAARSGAPGDVSERRSSGPSLTAQKYLQVVT